MSDPGGLLNRNNAWVLTCESWMANNSYIVLPVNPEQLEITLPIRTTHENYRSTKITYFWRDRGFKSLFDSPIIEFQISSGNVLPVFSDDFRDRVWDLSRSMISVSGSHDQDALVRGIRGKMRSEYSSRFPGTENHAPMNTGVYGTVGHPPDGTQRVNTTDSGHDNIPPLYRQDIPVGLQNVFAMHALAEERRLRHRVDGAGKPVMEHTDNRVVAIINTLAFPRLVIYGWFTESGITVDESVNSFGEVTMKFSLVVTDTVPRLRYGQWQELMQTYRDNIAQEESPLDWGRRVNHMRQLMIGSKVNPKARKEQYDVDMAPAKRSYNQDQVV